MSRSSLSWPVSILAGFAIFMLMLAFSTLSAGAVTPRQGQACAPGNSAYPQCVRNTETAAQNLTNTAVSQTNNENNNECRRVDTGEVYPCPDDSTPTSTTESNNDGGNNGGNNNNTNQQPTATSTFTATATRTVTATTTAEQDGAEQPATPTATRPASPTDSGGTGEAGPPTATPALPPGVTTIACIPGETVELAGEAPPNTPLLLFFGERPVGGGVSGPSGAYRLRLQVGDERPGLYLVEVRERAGRALVDQFGCQVPAFTPTPTPLQ